ncbi:signal recognition particle subunit SRP21 ASCRUDRAFT_75714 [Ascoidea rubescens DSM 1968]|uniref:SRP9 domain-containing protein n=1 Tax=Ascoidea rubescens DSM 1968 TaxID=1344418 RepID=A0A1D2VH46_9ASCO|nr:hypothetical protein ASCRUDRAFT_75714 [Ascoidea rubescens DSM 1968]ODV60956.1 hypothetical protein ASCRUDRAFT_75714 [Ascoidea rubescens DSM 1968]
MTNIASVELFIDKSIQLFGVDPNNTKVSMTYGSSIKKESKSKSKTNPNKILKNANDSKDSKLIPTNFISFKIYNPNLGHCYNFKSIKFKELSRILAALGPRGIQISISNNLNNLNNNNKQPITNTANVEINNDEKKHLTIHKKGISSIMSNVEFNFDEPIESNNNENENESVSNNDTKDGAKSTVIDSTNTNDNEKSTAPNTFNKKKNKNKKKKGKKH